MVFYASVHFFVAVFLILREVPPTASRNTCNILTFGFRGILYLLSKSPAFALVGFMLRERIFIIYLFFLTCDSLFLTLSL